VFGAYEIDGYDVTIQLNTTENVDKVTLFDPDGEPWKQTSVATGQEQVSFNIKGYSDGEYRYAAVDTDTEEIREELTKTYKADVQVADVRAYAESDEMYQEPEGSALRRYAHAPTILFENTGTAPGKVQWVGFEGENIRIYHSLENCQEGGCTTDGVQDLPLSVGVSGTSKFEFVEGAVYGPEQVDSWTYNYYPEAGTVDDSVTMHVKTEGETIAVDLAIHYEGGFKRQTEPTKQPPDTNIRIEMEG
jgi:hypothetical protein